MMKRGIGSKELLVVLLIPLYAAKEMVRKIGMRTIPAIICLAIGAMYAATRPWYLVLPVVVLVYALSASSRLRLYRMTQSVRINDDMNVLLFGSVLLGIGLYALGSLLLRVLSGSL